MKMYFIAIVLPHELDEKILKLKKAMFERFNCRVGLKSPAHITIIAPFWVDVEKENQLCNDVDEVSRNLSVFVLRSKNFSAFKPRTIFIDIEESDSLKAVKRAADEDFSAKDYKIKKENRPFHPHITVANRDLSRTAFAEAWLLFAEKKFKKEWLAEGLSILKHNGKNWDVIYTTAFPG